MQNISFTLFHSIDNTKIILDIMRIVDDFSLPRFITTSEYTKEQLLQHYGNTDCLFMQHTAEGLVKVEKYDIDATVVININQNEKDIVGFDIVLNWLNNQLNGVFDESIRGLYNTVVKNVATNDDTCKATNDEVYNGVAYDPELPYHFRSVGNVYELIQPNVDRPYTTIVDDDPRDFFTNLFACTCFGSSADVAFLAYLWNELGLEGEFNMNEMLQKRIKEIASGAEYPRVYRQPLEEVIKNVSKKV